MVQGFVSSMFEWRVENFFFCGEVLSPVFALCVEPEKEVKAQLMLRHAEDGFLSVYVIFLPGGSEKGQGGTGWEHYLSIPGQQTRSNFSEVFLGEHRGALGIERLLRIDSLVKERVFCPDGVLTLRHHVFQRTTQPPLMHSASNVSRLNVRSTLLNFFIPFTTEGHLHDFPFTLTDDRAGTVRVFSSNGRLSFGLLTKGRTDMILEMTVRRVDEVGKKKQRTTILLRGGARRKALSLPFEVMPSGPVHLELGFSFHEEGDVEHCERELVPEPMMPERRCRMSSRYDVQFHVENQHFFGNRDVLSRHSPVFARMFATDGLEALSGQVRVKEADPESVRLLLSFVHSGRLEASIQLPQIQGLYRLADRYLVQSLLQALQNHLLSSSHLLQDAEESAVMGLRLATLFPSEDGSFKNRMEDFFDVESRRRVVYSDAFRELVRELPAEGCRIMYKIFLKKYLPCE